MILHINTSREWRGGEQQLYYLAQGLNQNKIEQLIVCQPNSPLFERCTEAGFSCYPLEMKGEWDRKAVKAIRNICLEKKVKLIHTHTAHAHGLAVFAKRNTLNIPLIVSRRVDFKPGTSIFSRWKYGHSANDYYLPVSQAIKKVMLEAGISPEKLITVYSGIDLKRFSKLPSGEGIREEFSIPKKTIIIGNIAALVDHKDQETLIRAIEKMKTQVPFKVLIVGEGRLERKLKTLTKELGLEDKIIFTGYRTDILALLSLFDIFTLTSKEEGLGTSVLDAMASALPVVATTGGGIGEMLTDGQGAFLSPVGDSTSLAKSFDSLVESEALRNSFGTFNKLAVKRFSCTETSEKTKLIYYSLLGDSLFGKDNYESSTHH
ncbi:glycosyl transferase [Leptospira kobayashii]|uniref:Glycosyl transferase n=1 Tax=Leptospira kobayashii TaxID=1917830 RepID=A0ABM7UGI2_9LEPT|nr:glycosyltransferase [Leptospira kobayashii]BDA77731.1 glycosyl transferase [Leptospira kobayashii]